MKKKNQISWNNYLPLELEREILARLPVKTLLQFRCVSKSWCSLIDTPDFNSLHFNLYNNNNNNSNNSTNPKFIAIHEFHHNYSITLRRSDTFRKIGAEIANFDHPFSIRQFCKGLLLIRHNLMMKLWNPSIGKCLILPECPVSEPNCYMYYKLGFAPSSNDYKIVAIKSSLGNTAVYSVNDHCWRVKTNNRRGLPLLRFGYIKRVVVSGGVIYWVMYDDQSKGPVICVYDFDVEEMRLVQPPGAVKGSMVWFIFRFGESIAVFTMSDESSCIWVMEKNGGSDEDCNWRVWFRGESNLDAWSLFFSIETEILYVQRTNMFVMVQKTVRKDRVISYNLTNHEIKHLAKSLKSGISFNTYVESSALHKAIEGQTLSSFP